MNRLLPKTYNQTSSSEQGRSQTVVVILSLIPGGGLLIASFVFVFVENICGKALRKKGTACFTKLFTLPAKLFQHVIKTVFELNSRIDNIILIKVHPQVPTS